MLQPRRTNFIRKTEKGSFSPLSLKGFQKSSSGAGRATRTELSRVAAGSGATLAAFTLIGLFTNVLLARLLAPEGLGIYASAFALANVLAVLASAGVATTLARMLPTYRSQQDPLHARGCLIWAFAHAAAVSMVLAGLVSVMTPLLSQAEHRSASLLAALLVPLMALSRLQQGALQGMERVVSAQIPERLIRPTAFALLLLLWPALTLGAERTAAGAMGWQLLAAGAAVLVGMALMARYGAEWITPPNARFQLRSWYRCGMLVAAANLAQVVSGQAGLVILPLFEEPAPIGYYRVALVMASFVGYPSLIGVHPLGALIARLHAEGKQADLERLTVTTTRLVWVGSILAAATLVVSGHLLLTALFGHDFADAYPLLIVLVIGELFSVPATWRILVLQMTGRERTAADCLVIGAGIYLVLTVALSALYGVAGAVIADAASRLLVSLLLIVRSRQAVAGAAP